MQHSYHECCYSGSCETCRSDESEVMLRKISVHCVLRL
jgi:hypothetical protein